MFRRKPPKEHGPPFGLWRHQSPGPPGFRPFLTSHFMKELFGDLETKDDAIDFIEMQQKRIQRHKSRLLQGIKRMESLESNIDNAAKEIIKMKEYSPEGVKKIIKRVYRDFLKEFYEEL